MVSDGKLRGPSLPRYVPGAGEKVTWHEQTRAWWEGWRRSPQAIRMMTDPDWQFLLETARLHHAFMSGDLSLAAELRLRAAKFGATPEDRARIGVEVGVGMPDGVKTRLGATSTGDAIVSSIGGRDDERFRRVVAEGVQAMQEQAARVRGDGRTSTPIEED